MSDNEHRQIVRDSLFVMADMRFGSASDEHRVKVRNLSSGGLMAEGDVRVQSGLPVKVNIRNIGWTEGTVAWVQDNRFGVAFCDEIDPKIVRAPLTAGEGTPRYVRPPLAFGQGEGPLRKV